MKTLNGKTFALLAAMAFIACAEPPETPRLEQLDLSQRSIERRAIEAVIWGMPAVNYPAHICIVTGYEST